MLAWAESVDLPLQQCTRKHTGSITGLLIRFLMWDTLLISKVCKACKHSGVSAPTCDCAICKGSEVRRGVGASLSDEDRVKF